VQIIIEESFTQTESHMTVKLLFFTCLLLCNFCECGTKNANVRLPSFAYTVDTKSPAFYDLSKPSQVWNLPQSLKEVSGIAYVNDSHWLLIEDVHPNLYLVHFEKEAVVEKSIPFAQRGDGKFDVEDVALVGNTAYVLWSHGVIYKVGNWNGQPTIGRWETGLTKTNNAEGLSFDPISHCLLIACKNQSLYEGEKKSTRVVYRFDLSSCKLLKEPFLLIHKKDFEEKEKEVSHFYPSAIALQPQTHDLYILSTKETKAMAVYSYEGRFKFFQLIDKELMPQPEGICFSSKGDLYISTEGKHGKSGKVLKFHPLQ
jgi:uncharacterized protein YjiK